MEATLEIPKQVENENNIKITELDYGDNVEKVEIDAVAELEKDGSMSDKNALKFVTADWLFVSEWYKNPLIDLN